MINYTIEFTKEMGWLAAVDHFVALSIGVKADAYAKSTFFDVLVSNLGNEWHFDIIS